MLLRFRRLSSLLPVCLSIFIFGILHSSYTFAAQSAQDALTSGQYKYDWNSTDKKYNLIIDLNSVPAGAGTKVYEGQLCENKAQPNGDFACYNEKEDSGTKVNRHTRGFFTEVMNDPNYKSNFRCGRINAPSRLVKPCLGDTSGNFQSGEQPLACYADWECCSGYCEPTTAVTFDPYNQKNIAKGTKGMCKPRPQGSGAQGAYVSHWPFAPVGKTSGEACSSDSVCQSKNCKDGKCTSANICKRCTPVGKKPTFGSPCCGEAATTVGGDVCVAIDANFLPASVEAVFGKSDMAKDKIDQLVDQDILSDLKIYVPNKGNCSFQYIVNGQNLTAAEGGGATTGPDPKGIDPSKVEANASIEKRIKALIHLKESIISIFEFLELWKSTSNPKYANDVFGIHLRMREAMRGISQMRYDTYFMQKALDKERDEKLAEIKKSMGKLEGKELQTAAFEFQVRSLGRMKEILALKRDVMFDAYNKLSDGYVKKEKDRGKGNPAVPLFSLMTWLKGNRRAGESMQSNPWTMGASIADDKIASKVQWGQQEEIHEGFDGEEGEENREDCHIQHDVIFRTSTKCQYTGAQEDVVEDTEEYEEEEDGFDSLSRYCVGTQSGSNKNLGDGYSYVAKGANYPFLSKYWTNVLADLKLPWFSAVANHTPLTYVTTYPALIFNDAGSLVSEGALSQNIRDNFTKYINDPVAHTVDLTLNSGGTFNANENFFGDEYKVLLQEFLKPEMAILESSVFLSSVSYTRLQPAHYQPHLILFVAEYVYQMANLYKEMEQAFARSEVCMDANAKAIGSGFSSGGAPSSATVAQTGSVDTGGVPIQDGSGFQNGTGAAGSSFGTSDFGASGNVGIGAGLGGNIGQGAFSTLAGSKHEALASKLHDQSSSSLNQARAARDRFYKNWGNTAIGKRAKAYENGLSKGLGGIVHDAKKATVAAAAAALKASSSGLGNLPNVTGPQGNSPKGSGSGSGRDYDAEHLQQLKANMNKSNGGGNSGGDNGMGWSDDGSDKYAKNAESMGTTGNSGVVDENGLIDASKREEYNFKNKEEDSIFKIITNRYMKSLDRILIRKR